MNPENTTVEFALPFSIELIEEYQEFAKWDTIDPSCMHLIKKDLLELNINQLTPEQLIKIIDLYSKDEVDFANNFCAYFLRKAYEKRDQEEFCEMLHSSSDETLRLLYKHKDNGYDITNLKRMATKRGGKFPGLSSRIVKLESLNDAQDERGIKWSFYTAVNKGNADVVKTYLDSYDFITVDCSLERYDESNAVMAAAFTGKVKVFKLLLSYNPDLTTLDKDGNDVVSHMFKRGSSVYVGTASIIKLLKDYGYDFHDNHFIYSHVDEKIKEIKREIENEQHYYYRRQAPEKTLAQWEKIKTVLKS